MTSSKRTDLRNIAIIAHVDHGKTTLLDAMLHQSGFFRANEEVAERVMDSNDLERERGITILAKHASVKYGDVTINIIDTPGHADFGGEVERTLMMADGALLLVDAAEGPLPQTRFVLGKALELGMPILVVINKIDRQDARADEVLNEVFDLFCDLEAKDEQADFTAIYAIGKDGIAKAKMDDEATDLSALMDAIVRVVPGPPGDADQPFRLRVHNVLHDEYVGRLAIGRIADGRIGPNQQIVHLAENAQKNAKAGTLFGFVGNERVKLDKAYAGDIVAIAGIDEVHIGDTLASPERPEPLSRIHVEEPTIMVRFLANTSPYAGLSGKWITSRHLRERLYKEAKRNLALKVKDTDSPDAFDVLGRGELMLTILAETMRREGYELAMGMPQVVVKEIDGVKQEPVELVVVDVPEEFVGAVTTSLGGRRGQMTKMQALGHGRSRVEFKVPSRGLIGFRSEFLTSTRGMGLLNTLFDGWIPWAGPMIRRKNGAIVADRTGKATPYSVFNLQPRGVMIISPGEQVYEGMVIGEHNRENDLDVNVCREKKLTNVRAAGKDENVAIAPPRRLTIETALEFIDQDELVELTPDAIRVRKKTLAGNVRPKRRMDALAATEG